MSAYRDSDGASIGERLGNARLAATGAGIIAGTAAAKMTSRDFAKAGKTALSEGKAAYSEGADARIAAFKSESRGEAPISAGSPGGSGAVDSSYDSRYAPPPSDTNAAGVAAGAWARLLLPLRPRRALTLAQARRSAPEGTPRWGRWPVMMDTGKANRRPAPQQWLLGFPVREPPTHLPLWPIRVTDSAPTPATPMLPRYCSKIAVLSVTPH